MIEDDGSSYRKIYLWRPNSSEASSSQGSIGAIRLLAKQASRNSRWQARCTRLQNVVAGSGQSKVPGNYQDAYTLKFGQTDGQQFIVFREAKKVFRLQTSITETFAKLQTFAHKYDIYFEGNGYQIGDFVVSIARGRTSTPNKGVHLLIEVNTMVLSNEAAIRPAIDQLVRELAEASSFFGEFVPLEVPFVEFGLDTQGWSPEHSALQYFFACQTVVGAPMPSAAAANGAGAAVNIASRGGAAGMSPSIGGGAGAGGNGIGDRGLDVLSAIG